MENFIVIYGSSLFVLAVEATLIDQTKFNTMHISCEADWMKSQNAALVVVDAKDYPSLPLLSPPVPVLVLDVPNGRVTMIQQEQRPINNMNDLINMITPLMEANLFL